MSVKMGANRFPIDALLILDGPANVGVTKTSSGGTTSFIALDVLTSYWAAGDVAELLDMAVVVETSAISGTLATATVTIQVAPDTGAFGTPVTIAEAPVVSATGRAVIVVDRDEIISALAGATVGSLRAYLTLAGTSPSITYTAYVAPLAGL